ncbi:MAG: SRPBCC family protein, partial [Candidatus Binatia bacterium]
FWSPATRLLVGAAGATVAAAGLLRGSPLGAAASFFGLAALARSATNLETRRLIGIGAGRRAIDVQKTITIAAPIEDVFGFWGEMENFPRFMTHVREVRRISENRFHWKVEAAGIPFEWDAEITEVIPNELLAWESVESASVRNAGVIRFERTPDGTRVHVRLSYNPPAGALGHAFARLLGADPKAEMNDDLMRLKSLLEEGKATGRGGTVRREEIERST